MKLLTGAVLSAALLATTPAFAGRDRDRDDDHDRDHDKHYWKHQKHAYKNYGPPQYVVRRDVHHYYAYQPEMCTTRRLMPRHRFTGRRQAFTSCCRTSTSRCAERG